MIHGLVKLIVVCYSASIHGREMLIWPSSFDDLFSPINGLIPTSLFFKRNNLLHIGLLLVLDVVQSSPHLVLLVLALNDQILEDLNGQVASMA